MKEIKPRLNAISNYLGQGSVALINFAFIPVYIRYLGIEAYGLVGVLATLQTILGILDMGLTLTLNREFASVGNSRAKKQNALSLLKSIEILISIVCILIFGFILYFSGWLSKEWINSNNLPENAIKDFLATCGLIVSLRLIEGIYKSVLVGLQRQILYNILHVFLSALRSVGAVIVVIYISPTIEVFFLWQSIASIISVALWYMVTYKVINTIGDGVVGHFSTKILRANSSFSMGILGMSFLSLLVTNIDKIFLPKFISLTDYGYYALASTLSGVLILLIGPVVQAAFPRLSEFYANNDQVSYIQFFHKCSQLTTILVASVSCIIIFQPNLILELWNIDAQIIQKTSALLSVLTFGTLLNCIMWMPYQVALSSGRPSLIVKLNAIGVIIIAPVFALVAPIHGSAGAAWVWVLCNMYFMFYGCYIIFKEIISSEFYVWLVEDTIKPILIIFSVGYAASSFLSQFSTGYIKNLFIIGLILFLNILFGMLSVKRTRAMLINIFRYASNKLRQILV
jgi:O-antigen/teichoic acid export membrane protein